MIFNLRLIPLLPFIGAALLLLFGRRWKRETVLLVAAGAIAAACLVSPSTPSSPRCPAPVNRAACATWSGPGSPAGDLKVDLAFRMDALSGLLCLVITFIGFLIHLYASGYMARRPRLRALLRLPEPVLRRDAGAGAGRQPAGDVRRLGGRRPLQLPADRVLVHRQRQRRRRQEGVHRQPHRRLRLPAGDVPAVPVHGHAEVHGDHGGGGSRLGAADAAAVAGRSRSPSGPACCCSSARAASRRRSRSTSGCPTRWRARRRSRR